MDWTKAKNILIVALILTNLVLIYTYCFQENIFVNNEEEMLQDTINLLESKNIFIETEIPDKHNRMAVLSVEYDKMNQDIIDEQLAIQQSVPEEERTDEKLIQMTSTFIENCNLMTENVTFHRIERKSDQINVTYKNYIDEIAIEESYIIFTVTDGKVTEMKRYWLNPVKFGKMKKEVIPAVAALIKFMSENEEDGKIYVEDISMVYWLDASVFDTESPVSDTAFPTWKITYNRGKIQYVMAFEQ